MLIHKSLGKRSPISTHFWIKNRRAEKPRPKHKTRLVKAVQTRHSPRTEMETGFFLWSNKSQTRSSFNRSQLKGKQMSCTILLLATLIAGESFNPLLAFSNARHGSMPRFQLPRYASYQTDVENVEQQVPTMSNYKLRRAEKREGPAYWLLAYIRWSTGNGFMKISHERAARTIVSSLA